MTDDELYELVRSMRTLADQVLRELDRRRMPVVVVEEEPSTPLTFGERR